MYELFDSLFSHYIAFVIISGFLGAMFCIYAYYGNKDFLGRRLFLWTASLYAIYTFGYSFELASDTIQQISFWVKVQYLGIPFIAPCGLLLILYYLGLDKFVVPRKVWGLFVIPCLTFLLVHTNDFHHVYYKKLSLRSDSPEALVVIEPGLWYYVHWIYSFSILLISLFILLQYWGKTIRIYRKQMFAMTAAVAIPLLGGITYALGFTPYGVDLMPMLMCCVSVLYIYSVNTSGMLTISPIARDMIFESMRDGVLVLNMSSQIIDYNAAAAQIIPDLSPLSIGKNPLELWKGYAESESYISLGTASGEFVFDMKWVQDGTTFYYNVRSSFLKKPGGQIVGRTVVMIDITEQKLLQNKLRYLAEMDSLTSIYNRGAFVEKSNKLLTEAYQANKPISFILFDIDLFKQINDLHGHSIGDRALVHVVELCKQHLSKEAVFGRYGGEEFVISLPDMTIDQAAIIAEQLRSSIADHPLRIDNKEFFMTASFGVTEACSPDERLETHLHRADMALYRSKNSGRNTVQLIINGEAHMKPSKSQY